MLKKVFRTLLALAMVASTITFSGNAIFAAQDDTTNVALNKTAVASSTEADSVRAALATDGDKTSMSSRWGSNLGSGPEWIYVDLGETMNVKTVKVYWETRKATAYSIQIASGDSAPTSDDGWETVKAYTTRPTELNEIIEFDEVKQARFVRLYIPSYTSEDPDGGVTWATISIYEMEVYGGVLPDPATDTTTKEGCLAGIKVTQPNADSTKLEVSLPVSETYNVTYNGTDYEQVIGADLTIYKPIVTQTVKASFKVQSKTDPTDYAFKEVDVIVPGQYSAEAGDNAKPTVLPELREWKGRTGNYTITEATKIVYKDAVLKTAAEELANDYKDLSGKTLAVQQGDSSVAVAGDIYLETVDGTKGLDNEGYIIDINDKVVVQSETSVGGYWATRTILQILKQNNNTTIPCGITRDYPLYKVRGIVLDVGRKSFKFDFVQQLVKAMAWYKMNDLQLHLADNYIWLEELGGEEGAMNAASGFRLESDIKEGGNNGLNKADLTSKDVFYTKDQMRSLIQDSRVIGVNIIPEIDTPAHSLALTKVRPDLRMGTSGRQNDHLDLIDKYDDSVAFVESIWNEYITGDNPVFDQDTVLHIGADEYSGSSVALRKYANEMFRFVKASGRTPRIWGSWSQSRQGEALNAEGVQINLWNYGYANIDEMYEMGFDLIDVNDGQFYIVPNAGYYYDYLNHGTCYNDPLNAVANVTIPNGDPQVLGGEFAIWNDMVYKKDNGMSEYDIYDRIQDAMPYFSGNAWGKGGYTLDNVTTIAGKTGEAPNTNFGYEVASVSDHKVVLNMDDQSDASENGYAIAELENAAISDVDYKKALELKGGASYAKLNGITTAGLGNSLRVKVKRTSYSTDDQVLFESAYGSIKAVQGSTGKVGITREGRDFSFNYELPMNVWVELEFKNRFEYTSLYVNGELVETIGEAGSTKLKATCMFPMEYIGSKNNAFIGYVDDVRLSNNATYASTMELDILVSTANTVLANTTNAELSAKVNEAKALINNPAPEAASVEAKIDEIKALLSTAEFEKADYTQLNALLAVTPQDLALFTEESVNSLNQAKAAIINDLPKGQQSIVDGYVATLEAALNGMTLKEQQDANYVNTEDMTMSASSYQDASAAPSMAIDNDPSTMWHSKWSITTMPHWLQVEFSEAKTVDALIYTPRANNGNGTVSNYTIQTSMDGTNFTDVATSVAVTCVAGENVFEFTPTEAKYVRLVYNTAKNNNGTAAELRVRLAQVDADIAGLNQIISEAQAFSEGTYVEVTYQALQTKLAEATTLAASENPDIDEVNQMKGELALAIKGLRVLTVSYARNLLSATIDSIAEINADDYMPDSYQALLDKGSEAEALLLDNNATIDELLAAADAINDAIDALVEDVDKTELEALIASANAIDTDLYSTETLATLSAAITAAQQVDDDEAATLAGVANAIANLQAAIDGLAYKPLNEENLINTEANKTAVTILEVSSQCGVTGSPSEGAGLGTAEATLDYNNNTYWHSDWQNDSEMPQNIKFDLGKEYALTDVTFLPRQNGYNGDIFKLEIKVSSDNETYTSVGTFEFEKAANGYQLVERSTAKRASFTAVNARYVDFIILSSGGDSGNDKFSSVSEIRFYGSEAGTTPTPEVDKAALVDKIAEAKATATEGKTEESVAALNAAITAAEAVNNDANATQDEVNAQVIALDNAIKGLEDQPVVPSVDKAALVDKIAEAKATATEGKSEESVAALNAAITAAEAVNNDANATQDEVNAQVSALDNAIKGLEDKPAPVVDKTNLEDAITRASIYVEENLSAEDKVAYSAALTAAQAVLADENATEKEIEDAITALREAIKNVDSNMSFPDVKADAWYVGVVDEAFARGLMGPTDIKKNTFSPEWNISRGMVAAVLYRMAGAPDTAYVAKFSDVKEGEWYSQSIIWANNAGIINGYKDGNFGPDNSITREELAIMLRNYAMNVGKLDVNADADLSQFEDEEAISSYALPAVKWVVANGIITGKGGTSIAPSDTATRGECAKMFMMLQDLIVK